MPENRGLRRSQQDKDFSTSAGRALEPVPGPAPTSEPPAPGSRRRRPHLPPISGQTTRLSVDVPISEHRALKQAADAIADEIGVNSVPLGHLMQALAHQMINDSSLRLRDSASKYLLSRVDEAG